MGIAAILAKRSTQAFRRIAFVVALLLFAVLSVGGAASAATPSAQPDSCGTYCAISSGHGNCPVGYLCEWTGPNAGGSGVAFAGDVYDYGQLPSSLRFIQDHTESWENNGTYSDPNVPDEVEVYVNAGPSGAHTCDPNGEGSGSHPSWGNTTAAFTNDISAHVWVYNC